MDIGSKPFKIVLGGPPQSGKSCLREGLKQVLMQFHRDGKLPYPYVLTACPDGEGAWYSETVRRNPELAKQLKENYKKKFTEEFARLKADDVKNISLPLTIIDIGGKIDEKNRMIVKAATHAIILAGDKRAIPAWMSFFDELELKIIAILESDYFGVKDVVYTETPILTGRIHHLERGEDVSGRLTIGALATTITHMFNSKQQDV